MNKRISRLVTIGFALMLLLGIAGSVFLGYQLQLGKEYAKHNRFLVQKVGVPLYRARHEFMVRGQEVAAALIVPLADVRHQARRDQMRQAGERARAYLHAALASAPTDAIRDRIHILMLHDQQVTMPLAEEILAAGSSNADRARGTYDQRYLDAQRRSLELMDAALEPVSREADRLERQALERFDDSHMPGIATVMLLCVGGVLVAVFVRRAVCRLMQQANQATQEIHDLAELSFDVICTLDEQGKFRSVSGAFERIWGYAPEELVGTSGLIHVHPDERATAKKAIAAVVSGGALTNQRGRFIRKDGQTIFMKWSARWVASQRRIFCVAQDVTAATLAERALQASEQQLRAILSSAHEAFLCIDAGGRIIEWNTHAEAIFGWPAQEAIGHFLHELIIPQHLREAHVRGLQRFLRTGDAPFAGRRLELPGLHRDGHEIMLEISMTAIRQQQGFIFSAFLRDISQRKQAEAQLRETKEAAEAATQAKSEFLANISHEIRTPMNSVIGMAHLALMQSPEPRLRGYLEKILGAGQHLLGIINDVLDFSKIEAGRMELEAVAFNLEHVMRTVSDQIGPRAHGKGLDFQVRVKVAVPRRLVGDPLRLGQILINLCSNAVKFTAHGGVTVRITVLARDAQACRLKFAVQDTGVGIRAEDVANLFQPFRQADASITRQYGGTGLGLAICRQLVERMGGEIGVDSEPGRGSTFWFCASFAVAAGDVNTEKPDAPSSDEAQQTVKGARILLVEDNPFNQQVACELLAAAGVEAAVAEHGEQALEMLQRKTFDCVLMDMQMPVMDGLEATRRLRRMPGLATLKVIAMTANAGTEDRERCLAAGMDDFITKPVTPDVLYRTLARHLAAVESAGMTANPEPAPEAALVAASAEVIDMDALASLSQGDPVRMRRFADKFLQSAQYGMRELEAALEAQDPARLARIGHYNKSSARAVGALGFAALWQALEAHRDGGSLAEADEIAASLRDTLQAIEAVLKPIMQEEGSAAPACAQAPLH
ncbi:PAS domain S-box-containing protein [Noviherbaspirillum humi]|uniref:Virulence sensor protein BvgS n=1 Tax=Noviherbaspirillum humi TaxID=1688639 RepID=A0A239CDN0_9BURK|nr:PAS domain-containing hybrid sensor histidine kinase/response regulator [Noviherbaspirillum humi]SNS18069.1 PAS domain S-box-containing protein [Noviherbaspirillum humi]